MSSQDAADRASACAEKQVPSGMAKEVRAGARTVSDGSIAVDRDINGARGIMLRALYGNLGRFRAAGAEVAFVAE